MARTPIVVEHRAAFKLIALHLKRSVKRSWQAQLRRHFRAVQGVSARVAAGAPRAIAAESPPRMIVVTSHDFFDEILCFRRQFMKLPICFS